MSTFYKKTAYNPRELETQWLNIVIATHDMFCWCNSVWNHLLQGVLQRGSTFELDSKSIRLMQKCLISTAGAGTDPEQPTTSKEDTEKDGLDLTPGDLEKLFAEDDANEG